MALEKEVVVDRITVLEDGQMQVRQCTRIMEDGVELSKSYHRHVVAPTDDLEKEDKKVKDIAAAVCTDEVKAAYQARINAQAAESLENSSE